eukprot:scaffold10587_cov22-Tisochrysis_lutea.AAC.1
MSKITWRRSHEVVRCVGKKSERDLRLPGPAPAARMGSDAHTMEIGQNNTKARAYFGAGQIKGAQTKQVAKQVPCPEHAEGLGVAKQSKKLSSMLHYTSMFHYTSTSKSTHPPVVELHDGDECARPKEHAKQPGADVVHPLIEIRLLQGQQGWRGT